MRVLVIDSDPAVVRRLHRHSRAQSDIDVTSAPTAKSGRAVALGRSFNALIVDENLPDGRGTDILAEVARDQPGVALILITRGTDMTVAERATEFGVDRILVKPCDVRHVWNAIRDAVDHRTQIVHLMEIASSIANLNSRTPIQREPVACIPGRTLGRLTETELAIVKLANQGRCCKDIAAERRTAESTVRWHLKNIYLKLEVSGWRHLRNALRGA